MTVSVEKTQSWNLHRPQSLPDANTHQLHQLHGGRGPGRLRPAAGEELPCRQTGSRGMGLWLGGDRKVLKPEFLGLKAEANGARQGTAPATLDHVGRGRSRSQLSSPTHAGDIGLRPAGQGSPENTLKGPGPENAHRSTPEHGSRHRPWKQA